MTYVGTYLGISDNQRQNQMAALKVSSSFGPIISG